MNSVMTWFLMGFWIVFSFICIEGIAALEVAQLGIARLGLMFEYVKSRAKEMI